MPGLEVAASGVGETVMLMGALPTAAGNLVLAVRVGGELYALPLAAIEEVLPALPIEPLPQCPEDLRGVVFVRGQLIPVVEAAKCLGVARVRPLEPPIVTLRLKGRVVGVEVDEALDLLDLAAHPALSALTSPGPADLSPDAVSHAAGHGAESAIVAAVDVDGQTIRLLDTQRLASSGLLWENVALGNQQ